MVYANNIILAIYGPQVTLYPYVYPISSKMAIFPNSKNWIFFKLTLNYSAQVTALDGTVFDKIEQICGRKNQVFMKRMVATIT